MKTILEQLQEYQPFNEQEVHNKQVMIEFLTNHEDAFVRENQLAHMTATGWIVNKSHTRVLMGYHNIYKSWGWLGGHADGDKDLLRVAMKEVAEESGLSKVTPLKDGIYGINILYVPAHVKRGKYVNCHIHLDVEYIFEADENDPIRMKPDENSGVAWIDIDKINDYVTEEIMKPVYAVLNAKLSEV